MPVTLHVDAEAGVVRITYSEPFTIAHWLEAAASFCMHRIAPFNKQLGFLVDRTEVGDLPTSFMTHVVQRVVAATHAMKQRRVALVVRHSVVQSAMLQAMMYEEAGATVGVFTSTREAEDWLAQR